jgi:hypothetical protein
MSNHFLNVLTLTGRRDEIEALSAVAASKGPPLSFEALLPVPDGEPPSRWMEHNWGTGEPEAGMEPGAFEDLGDLASVAWTFSTLGNAPFKFAAGLAAGHPDVVVSTATVDPAAGYAEGQVWRDETAWVAWIDDETIEAARDPDTELVDEGRVLDEVLARIRERTQAILGTHPIPPAIPDPQP